MVQNFFGLEYMERNKCYNVRQSEVGIQCSIGNQKRERVHLTTSGKDEMILDV